MKKSIKWIVGIGGCLVVLVITGLLVAPMFVDVKRYKPEIESQVAKAVGRSFSIGGDLRLSLFPRAVLSFTDLRIGNPPGFKEKDFVSVKSFNVEVKLLPLLSREVQVNRFVVDGLHLVLEKAKDGRGNWEGLGKPTEGGSPPAKGTGKGAEKEAGGGLPIRSLSVDEFAVTGASLVYVDHAAGSKKEVSKLNLRLRDMSLDKPIRVSMGLQADGKPVSLEGKIGPVGGEPGKGTIHMDLSLEAVKELAVYLKGSVHDPLGSQGFDMAVEVMPFSPRKLTTAMGQEFSVVTRDPAVLNHIALRFKVKGDPQSVSVSEGAMELDQSKITFQAVAKEFSRPNVGFKMSLDQIDMDRYLPPAQDGKGTPSKEERPAQKKKADYAPLRKPVLEGEVRIGKVKVKGAQLQDLFIKVKGSNGVFTLDPLSLKAYQGQVETKGSLDVRADVAKTGLNLAANGVAVRPLLKDVLQKDVLEGTTYAKLNLQMQGDEPAQIKQTLNGNGDLRFTDGAVLGIDLAGMVRNLKASFGLAGKGEEKPKTDFAELLVPFMITNGLVNTTRTSMTSPLLRVLVEGKADLVKESLDFRVEPKFVGTLKGQGDTKERAGITVPVLVTGTFSDPAFAPDLKGMLEKGLKEGLSSPTGLKDMLKGGQREKKEEARPSPKEQVKGILKWSSGTVERGIGYGAALREECVVPAFGRSDGGFPVIHGKATGEVQREMREREA